MPELPEVEVVRAGLERWVTGALVDDVEVLHPRAIRRHVPGAVDLTKRLRGRRLGAAERRGKFLWIPLDAGEDEALVAHLGMSGQLLVQPPEAPDETHLRVRLSFADAGRELRFVDQRTFGGLALDELDVEPLMAGSEPQPHTLPRSIAHIARDPLDPRFDDAAFAAALRRRRTGLKRALLDQSLVSGIGNIYADEALWRAKLHYARPTETLTRAEIARVLAGVREVMADALAQGGT
ncbi:MAG: bifunctional DNA-formamidopyrimidine glycosylase/DNA-(apurinic or apyrimidinic site) lyase, partial [Actinomycetes bacterium]